MEHRNSGSSANLRNGAVAALSSSVYDESDEHEQHEPHHQEENDYDPAEYWRQDVAESSDKLPQSWNCGGRNDTEARDTTSLSSSSISAAASPAVHKYDPESRRLAVPVNMGQIHQSHGSNHNSPPPHHWNQTNNSSTNRRRNSQYKNRRFPPVRFVKENPHGKRVIQDYPPNLTAEDVASLPPPGLAGPSSFSFSPNGQYLAFLSSCPTNPNSNSSSYNRGGKVAANAAMERKLCAIDTGIFYSSSSPFPPRRVSTPLPHIFPLLNMPQQSLLSENDDNLSLEEKLRRERQRVQHSTGVTHFCWCQRPTLIRSATRNGFSSSLTSMQRLIVPLRGNIYVQDGVTGRLRLAYDKSTLQALNAAEKNNSENPNNASSGAIIGRDTGAIDPQLSPDGSMIAFVAAAEIYVVDASSLNATPIRLTFGARAKNVTHGLADFVAQEEMDRYRGFWWNPASNGICLTEVDESHIPLYRINHQGKEATDSSAYEDHRYPFVGMANPHVKLGFISVGQASTGEAATVAAHNWSRRQWFNPPKNASAYLARVSWLPDGAIAAQWQDRSQKTLEVVRIDPNSGESVTLLTERSETWINLHHMMRIVNIPQGSNSPSPTGGQQRQFSFLFASERTGFSHLYLYTFYPERKGPAQLIRTVTSGDWVVESIVGVDVEKNAVYFIGTLDSALERHLYVVPLLDTAAGCNSSAHFNTLASPNIPLPPKRLTILSGMHYVVMDASCRLLVDSSSDLGRPPSVRLYALHPNGPFQSSCPAITELLLLHDAAEEEKLSIHPSILSSLFPSPEIMTVSSPDGVDLHAALYRPDASLHGPGPYPLAVGVYGGPHVQRVNRSWMQCVDLRAQRLRDLGFAVVKCDNRGSSRRGLAFEGGISRRLGNVEIQDQVSIVQRLVAMGVADPHRVGIYGWSYGGYLAAMALCRAPETFHVAIAGAPVTSWDGYDTHYTERYMGTPANNSSGYKDSSILEHVNKMRGRLLLVHGLIDENVHFRHTARLINRLIAAGKDYDLLLFPDERHSPRRLRDRIYMEQRISDYFVEHLMFRKLTTDDNNGENGISHV
eukprot:CAMPEP_0194340638 /NCGR_PEP_ID=MMETSP0171-20130528/87093_1 /TAXON_ID=218684 /ORGANISM="Corethron pennatum, Strain L29A3" /LENGTH=1063 /DNA_ID=CAMNT_0039105675 /DNA_START=119 /DNA_END=3306 /DNA_ORIENTATION=-